VGEYDPPREERGGFFILASGSVQEQISLLCDQSFLPHSLTGSQMTMVQNARAALKQWAGASINRQIFSAAFVVGVITIGVKMVAMLRELMIAWQFGTSDAIDAYLIAWVIPNFVVIVVVGSFNAAFIPVYIQTRDRRGKEAAQKLFSSATLSSAVLLVVIVSVAALTVPHLLPLIASSFSSEKLALTKSIFYSLLPWVVFSAVMQVWAAALNAEERFFAVSATPLLTPLITLLLLGGFAQLLGVYALVVGVVGGTALEAAVLGLVLHRRGSSLKPVWGGFDRDMRQVAGQMLPMIAGGLLINSNQIVDQTVAASLSGPGQVASLNFGVRLVVVVVGILSVALSTAVIPYFSKLAAARDWQHLRSTFKKTVWLSFLATVPLTLIIIIFSTMIIQLFLQRGAFTNKDTQLVSQIQIYAALQIPFYIAAILGIRLITALQQNAVIMRISAVTFGVNIIADVLLARYLGVAGIALSTTIVYITACLLIFGYIYGVADKRLLAKQT
jgi:putative peptidoglycan lipid II flippase